MSIYTVEQIITRNQYNKYKRRDTTPTTVDVLKNVTSQVTGSQKLPPEFTHEVKSNDPSNQFSYKAPRVLGWYDEEKVMTFLKTLSEQDNLKDVITLINKSQEEALLPLHTALKTHIFTTIESSYRESKENSQDMIDCIFKNTKTFQSEKGVDELMCEIVANAGLENALKYINCIDQGESMRPALMNLAFEEYFKTSFTKVIENLGSFKELGNDTFVELAIRCIEHCYKLDSSYFGENSKKIFDTLREDTFADLSIGINDSKTIDALYNIQSLKEFRIVKSITDLNEIIKISPKSMEMSPLESTGEDSQGLSKYTFGNQMTRSLEYIKDNQWGSMSLSEKNSMFANWKRLDGGFNELQNQMCNEHASEMSETIDDLFLSLSSFLAFTAGLMATALVIPHFSVQILIFSILALLAMFVLGYVGLIHPLENSRDLALGFVELNPY